MSKQKFYPEEDINDIIEDEQEAFMKGGPGSGIRGHKTHRDDAKVGGKIMNRKTGKLVSESEFYDDTTKKIAQLANYLGGFQSMRGVANAVEQATGHKGDIAFMFAKELVRRGRVEKMGNVYMVMGEGRAKQKEESFQKRKTKMVDALMEAHDQANDHEEDYDSDALREKFNNMSPAKLEREYEDLQSMLKHN